MGIQVMLLKDCKDVYTKTVVTKSGIVIRDLQEFMNCEVILEEGLVIIIE